MPTCEIAIISPPRLHSTYRELFPNYSCCFFNFDGFKISPPAPSELAVIDCDQSPEQGLTIIQGIKSSLPEIPIVLVTSFGSEEIVRKAFRSGVRDYFRRPFDIDEFKGVIDALLEIKLTNRERRSPHVARVQSNHRKLPVRLLRAIEFIEQQYEIKEIYLEQVAAEACLSKFHFIRLFKEHFGTTPMQYVARMRVEKAMSIMNGSPDSITHVAYQSGFTDTAELNRHFKRITGITPSEYRAKVKPAKDDHS